MVAVRRRESIMPTATMGTRPLADPRDAKSNANTYLGRTHQRNVNPRRSLCPHLDSSVPREQRRWLFTGLCVSFMMLAIATHSSAQQMQIKKSQMLVLYLSTPTGRVEEYNGGLAYRSLIQEHPFIEINLIQPVPAKRLHRGRTTFACEEVGAYTDSSARETWTIGKRCKLR